MFEGEQSRKQGSTGKFSLCCSHGAVQIPPIKEPPDIIKNLLIGSTKRDRDFRKKHKSIQFKFGLCFHVLDWKGI